MSEFDKHQLIEKVVQLAQQAGEAILAIYKSEEYEIKTKEDESPLTTADLAANEIIEKSLRSLTENWPVLSEESESISYEERKSWEYYWLVDPLDGTKEFIARTDEFTVNVALIHNGSPIMGVVYVPVTGVCYYALKGEAAYKQALGKERELISVRPCADEKIVVTMSRRHDPDRVKALLDQFKSFDIVVCGSSLKFCLIAEGAADVYFRYGPTSEWDSAAAQCVVEAAGGAVLTMDMQSLCYNAKDSLINPPFIVIGDGKKDWAELLELLKGVKNVKKPG